MSKERRDAYVFGRHNEKQLPGDNCSLRRWKTKESTFLQVDSSFCSLLWLAGSSAWTTVEHGEQTLESTCMRRAPLHLESYNRSLLTPRSPSQPYFYILAYLDKSVKSSYPQPSEHRTSSSLTLVGSNFDISLLLCADCRGNRIRCKVHLQ